MKSRHLLPVVTGLVLTACSPGASAAVSADGAGDSGNPLLQPSPLPLQYPPFDRIRNEHFLPALQAGMAEQLKEVAAIAGDSAAPTFDNTVLALERSGQLFNRALTVFSNLNATITNPDMQQIQQTVAPQLAAHRDAILLDSVLYQRLQAVAATAEAKMLDPESAQLLARALTMFRRAGAGLGEA